MEGSTKGFLLLLPLYYCVPAMLHVVDCRTGGMVPSQGFKRRRAQQLKVAKQKEKEWLKAQRSRDRMGTQTSSYKRHITFEDSVVLLEAAARNDIAELAPIRALQEIDENRTDLLWILQNEVTESLLLGARISSQRLFQLQQANSSRSLPVAISQVALTMIS
uniref:IBB domain-containing protein n=1 Tax=Anopheles maculatus TaxID=74869 RepID=A0A182T0C0_9DIPT